MGTSTRLVILAAFSVVFSLIFAGSALADTGCSSLKPIVTIFPSQISTVGGQVVAFTIQISNEDGDNCPIENFTVNGSAPRANGFGINFNPSTFSLIPGEAKTILMTVSVPSDAATNSYDVQVDASDVNFTTRQVSTITVVPNVQTCQVNIGNLRFKDITETNYATSFARHAQVSAFVDLSVIGNVVSNVTVNLFANGNLFDSAQGFYSGNSVSTIRFNNLLHMDSFVDSVNIRAVAVPFCNPSSSPQTSGTVSIMQTPDSVNFGLTAGTPNNTVAGGQIISRMFVKNEGTVNSTVVNVDAFLCQSPLLCFNEMDCGPDSIIFVQPGDITEVDCKLNVTSPGTYITQGRATFGNDKVVANSQTFYVTTNYGQTQPVQTNASTEASVVNQITYVCTGNMRQAVYSAVDGTKTSDVEFCINGCRSGSCVTSPGAIKKPTQPSTIGGGESANPNQPVFSPPQETSILTAINGFVDWIKNLLFSSVS